MLIQTLVNQKAIIQAMYFLDLPENATSKEIAQAIESGKYELQISADYKGSVPNSVEVITSLPVNKSFLKHYAQSAKNILKSQAEKEKLEKEKAKEEKASKKNSKR